MNGNAPSAANSRLVISRTARRCSDGGGRLGAFLALWFNAPESDLLSLWHDSYLWHVIRFSFWQAFLCPAVGDPGHFSRAGALPQTLPRQGGAVETVRHDADPARPGGGVWDPERMVVRAGWPPSLTCLVWSGPSPLTDSKVFCWRTSFSTCPWRPGFLQALEAIPGEQRQLAAQLGMRGWSFFRFVEWPWLRRQIPPVAALIFMLCFASFATVLLVVDHRRPPSNWRFTVR